jgi:uncharacterized membrane protein
LKRAGNAPIFAAAAERAATLPRKEQRIMADYEVTNVSASGNPPVTGALLAYILFGLGAITALVSAGGFAVAAPLVGLLGIVGIVVAYVNRDAAAGTWVASHLRWLIRTFWFSTLWGVVGGIIFVLLFIVILLGPLLAFGIWGATSVWVIYRVVRGYLLFKDSRPIPGM